MSWHRLGSRRMGGSTIVDTLVTLGSPHHGTRTAYLLPTPVARQLRPGSELLRELALSAPGCRTRFLVVWSRVDQVVVPPRHARLQLHDVGHICLSIDSRSLHRVSTALARSDRRRPLFRGRRPPSEPGSATVGARSSPAS